MGVNGGNVLGIESGSQIHVVNSEYFPALGMISIEERQSTSVKGVNYEENGHYCE